MIPLLKRGHAALRRGRSTQAGEVHHVTVAIADRRPVFADPEAARQACMCFVSSPVLGDATLLAWVLMPDHAHWLVQSGDRVRLPQVVCRLKSASARLVNRTLQRQGQLWAPAYHDHLIRDGHDLHAVARYIIANPVRAGLVASVREYPYWNALWL